jgi:hypothetical protein
LWYWLKSKNVRWNKKIINLVVNSTSDLEFLFSNFLENSHRCFLFLPNTSGCKKHYWIWCAKKLLGFFQSYLTRCVALKIVCMQGHAIGFLLRWACAMCKFVPFILWCQAIEFTVSCKRSLRTHPSCKSCNFFIHCHVLIMSSFILFLIIFGMGSLLMTNHCCML